MNLCLVQGKTNSQIKLIKYKLKLAVSCLLNQFSHYQQTVTSVSDAHYNFYCTVHLPCINFPLFFPVFFFSLRISIVLTRRESESQNRIQMKKILYCGNIQLRIVYHLYNGIYHLYILKDTTSTYCVFVAHDIFFQNPFIEYPCFIRLLPPCFTFIFRNSFSSVF